MLNLVRCTTAGAAFAYAGAALAQAVGFATLPPGSLNHTTASAVAKVLKEKAGINMLVFQFIIFRNVAKWDRDAPAPWAAKLAGLISLVCWTAIIAYGRWTAYFIA